MKNVHKGLLVIAGVFGLLLAQGDAYASGKRGGSEHQVIKKDFCITNPFTKQSVNAKVLIKGDRWRKVKHAVRGLHRSKFISKGQCEASPSGGLVKVVINFDHWKKWWNHQNKWRDHRGRSAHRDYARNDRSFRDDHNRRGGNRRGGDADRQFRNLFGYASHQNRWRGHRGGSAHRNYARNDRSFRDDHNRRGGNADRQFPEFFGYAFPIVASLDPWGKRGGLRSVRSVRYNPDRNILKVRSRYWVLRVKDVGSSRSAL